MFPRALAAAALAAATLALPVFAQPKSTSATKACGEAVTLKTHDGTTTRYALAGPREAPAGDRIALVLLVGGGGDLDLDDQGCPRALKGNFLVRSLPHFHSEGFFTALVDAPSDHQGGDGLGGFRTSADQAADLGLVVTDVRRRTSASVWVVGTSRGTISAAYAGRALGNKVDGVVLTSTTFRPTRQSLGLNGFPFRDIAAPLLFVHHANDECVSCCSYSETHWMGNFPLITVKGGEAQGNPCEAMSHHGYLGREKDVVAAIRNWAAGKPYPKTID